MHKTIWFKIHMILGLTAGFVLLVVGVTGAILSFEKEITKFINKDSYEVFVPNEAKLSTKELLEKLQEKLPEAKINSLSFSSDVNSSVIINVAGKGEGKEAKRGKSYYINPYTAEILPEIKGKAFFSLILDLHRRLMLGEVGKQVVAISTISLIILSLSGLYIYWGRVRRAFFRSLTFSFNHHGRAFLSTMHSSIGMWVLPFYLLASLTGLYWSYEWYNATLYKIAGVEKPQRNMPLQMQKGSTEPNFDDYQKAVELFNVLIQKEYSDANIRFPQKGSVYSFSYLDVDSAHYRARNTLELDINSNQIVKHERYEDKPLNEQLMKSILPLHTGEYFGIIGQIGMFLASFFMLLFTVTGVMLYLKRHKKRKKREIKE
ncbi:PepSY-associated TM helix domain-containing protein [Arcobacter caeni]|uniref:Sulfite reductase n=1 Tax=Arcobacter caeni TaxID=1912877 RepID=A0A363D470_9BACT|nr:PepSY-associated TM helix domain-containing protein [Arcobacter caeni]PUE66099.1 sulfite reductase [Arcobacter caeni]